MHCQQRRPQRLKYGQKVSWCPPGAVALFFLMAFFFFFWLWELVLRLVPTVIAANFSGSYVSILPKLYSLERFTCRENIFGLLLICFPDCFSSTRSSKSGRKHGNSSFQGTLEFISCTFQPLAMSLVSLWLRTVSVVSNVPSLLSVFAGNSPKANLAQQPCLCDSLPSSLPPNPPPFPSPKPLLSADLAGIVP